MKSNFTPFFSRFKPDPALHLVTGLFVIAVVLVGFNQFSKQIASPSCSTLTQISELKSSQYSIQAQLDSIDAQVADNNNVIVSLQESLVKNNSEIDSINSAINSTSDYYISQLKKTLDSRYAQYLTYKNKKVKSRLDITLEANYKKTYEDTLAQYNKDIATVNANKTRLVDLNNQKVSISAQVSDTDQKYLELNTRREKVQSELGAINASIENANNNICPSSETSCSNGEDDDKDGLVDCGDNDCSTDSQCTTITGCMNPCDSACTNYNPGDPSCNTGTGTTIEDTTSTGTGSVDIITNTGSTGAGYCTSDAECGSGQICSSEGCVNKKVDTVGPATCNDTGACNNGAVGACDYTSCHNTTNDSCVDSCADSCIDEYGLRLEFSWTGVRITNESKTDGCSSAGDHACDPDWKPFDWIPEKLSDRDPNLRYWGCSAKYPRYNCKTGKNEYPPDVHCSIQNTAQKY